MWDGEPRYFLDNNHNKIKTLRFSFRPSFEAICRPNIDGGGHSNDSHNSTSLPRMRKAGGEILHTAIEERRRRDDSFLQL
ncbi:MAG: hypothetical protein Q9178_001598 [Gyalolechia marmorata]